MRDLYVIDELRGADSRGGPGHFTINDAVVHQASRSEGLEWLGWEECEKCEGTGRVTVLSPYASDNPYPCPNCLDGLVPPARQVEAASLDYMTLPLARAALIAAMKEVSND